MSRRRTFSAEFKAKAVLEALSGSKSNAEVCRQYGIGAPLLSTWKATFLERAALVFQEDEHSHAEQARIAELERLVGRQALEIEVLKKPPASWLLHGAETGVSMILAAEYPISLLGQALVKSELTLRVKEAGDDRR